jgi:hypothetical protein
MKFSLKTLIPLITIVLSVSSNSFAMIYTDHAKDPVQNPNLIEIGDFFYTKHGLTRMIERGLMSKDIERTISIGNTYACSENIMEKTDTPIKTAAPIETNKCLAIDPSREIAVVYNPKTNVIISAMREVTNEWIYNHEKELVAQDIKFSLKDYGREADIANILEHGIHYALPHSSGVACDETYHAVFYTKKGTITACKSLSRNALQKKLEKRRGFNEEPFTLSAKEDEAPLRSYKGKSSY